MIPGLVAKDNGNRITVEYQDILTIDLSRLMERLFDRAFGPAYLKETNVIPMKKESEDEPTR